MKKILSILLTYLITLCLKRKSIIIQKILQQLISHMPHKAYQLIKPQKIVYFYLYKNILKINIDLLKKLLS